MKQARLRGIAQDRTCEEGLRFRRSKVPINRRLRCASARENKLGFWRPEVPIDKRLCLYSAGQDLNNQ